MRERKCNGLEVMERVETLETVSQCVLQTYEPLDIETADATAPLATEAQETDSALHRRHLDSHKHSSEITSTTFTYPDAIPTRRLPPSWNFTIPHNATITTIPRPMPMSTHRPAESLVITTRDRDFEPVVIPEPQPELPPPGPSPITSEDPPPNRPNDPSRTGGGQPQTTVIDGTTYLIRYGGTSFVNYKVPATKWVAKRAAGETGGAGLGFAPAVPTGLTASKNGWKVERPPSFNDVALIIGEIATGTRPSLDLGLPVETGRPSAGDSFSSKPASDSVDSPKMEIGGDTQLIPEPHENSPSKSGGHKPTQNNLRRTPTRTETLMPRPVASVISNILQPRKILNEIPPKKDFIKRIKSLPKQTRRELRDWTSNILERIIPSPEFSFAAPEVLNLQTTTSKESRKAISKWIVKNIQDTTTSPQKNISPPPAELVKKIDELPPSFRKAINDWVETSAPPSPAEPPAKPSSKSSVRPPARKVPPEVLQLLRALEPDFTDDDETLAIVVREILQNNNFTRELVGEEKGTNKEANIEDDDTELEEPEAAKSKKGKDELNEEDINPAVFVVEFGEVKEKKSAGIRIGGSLMVSFLSGSLVVIAVAW